MKEGQKGEVGLVSFTSRREREENLAGVPVTWHGPARTAHWPAEAPGTAPAAGHRLPAAPAVLAAQHPAERAYMPHTVTTCRISDRAAIGSLDRRGGVGPASGVAEPQVPAA
jgi:hypothetical protein